MLKENQQKNLNFVFAFHITDIIPIYAFRALRVSLTHFLDLEKVFTHLYIAAFENVLLTTDFSLLC